MSERSQQAAPGATATSTASSRTPPPPTPAPKKKVDASCRSCARLVQEILQNPESRPRQVLQSLIGGMTRQASTSEEPSFRLKPVEDGMQVEMRVPNLPYTLPQRWKTIALQDKSSSSPPTVFQPTPVLATSAAPTPTTFTTETIQIECRPCDTVGPEQGARALIMGPTPLSIVACTNRLTPGDKDEMAQVLVHELLHAYDVKRLNLDFTDCESMAYSEVRAAREAECYSSSPWQAPSFLKEYCVKQKAIAATHNLFPSQGRKCVRAVFATAYEDPRPFQPEELQKYVQTTFQHQQQRKENHPSSR